MPKGIPGKVIIICPDCGEKKEHFANGRCKFCYGRYYRSNFRSKEKHAAYMRRWNQENPERAKIIAQRSYYKHREKNKAARRRDYREHCEDRKATVKRYREENRERVKVCKLRWQKENPEKKRIIARRYRKNHPEKAKEHKARRRATEMNARGDASASQIMARIAYYGYLCYLCGDPHEQIDHVIPLSKGGSNWPANLRPICGICNSSKGDKSLGEFITHNLGLRQGDRTEPQYWNLVLETQSAR